MLQFLATSTPFFAVIALGAFTAWRGLFSADAVRVFNTFAFMVATPAMVLRVMSQLRDEEAVTVVVVTHDDHVAAAADRIIAMGDGRVLDPTTSNV